MMASCDSAKPTVPPLSSLKHCKRNIVSIPKAPEFEDILTLLHGSDPVRLELTRLDNQLREKERELGEAQAEIKALNQTERLKNKALHQISDELTKIHHKLKENEDLLETKNLQMNKLTDEKKQALAAQFAAEATLRRVHASLKDDDIPPIETILAPLEAQLKLARQEIVKLQEDNRALDRLTKSKEAALLEADQTVQMALAKASMVEDLHNRNQELMKQVEICQEENKIVDKMQRQKVAEVEKLTQTVHQLEESILAGGAAANAVHEYQRRVQEMSEEMKTLERELARAKVTANRVATVVANEWKDRNDKVMPVKQWLEERKVLQSEMQHLRDKLAVAERTAKAEAQLKEKYLIRFKFLEEQFKGSLGSSFSSSHRKITINNGSSHRGSVGGADISRMPSNGFHLIKTPVTHSKNASTLLKHAKVSSKSLDDGIRSYEENKKLMSNGLHANPSSGNVVTVDVTETYNQVAEEYVSGVLYDLLQKDVVTLKRSCQEKEKSLKNKDEEILILGKKVDTLNKALEVETRKYRREIGALKEEMAAMRGNAEHNIRACSLSAHRGALPRSYSLSGTCQTPRLWGKWKPDMNENLVNK